MSPKAHGTTEKPVQENLRWSCDRKVADKICSFNRHYAEVGSPALEVDLSSSGIGFVSHMDQEVLTSCQVHELDIFHMLSCLMPHLMGCFKPHDPSGFSHTSHDSQYGGYWETTAFLKEVDRKGETTFYDSVSGRPLFIAPRGRSWEDFEAESRSHGWPSFRDQEVVWDDVRVLPDGEAVSVAGTHLGHNLPDRKGNRYCINLVSVAGRPL